MNYQAAALEVRRWRIERSVRDMIWVLCIWHRLRQGPAPTRSLAWECGVVVVDAGAYSTFCRFLRNCPRVRKIGQMPMATGIMNNVYALDEPCP